MKPFPLHTLILLGVLHHFGSCSECESRCEPKFERVGKNVTIKCSITNPDQDGVYLLTQREETSTEERVLYYYKEGKPDGVLTPETPYEGRVEINRDFGNFSVSISNVSEQDSGVYWCKFNKLDVNTISQQTCLFVQSETKCTEKRDWNQFFYLAVICVMFLIILFLAIVLVKMCTDRGNYRPKQQPSNGVYEVMRSNTMTALTNPAYESSQRRTQSQLC